MKLTQDLLALEWFSLGCLCHFHAALHEPLNLALPALTLERGYSEVCRHIDVALGAALGDGECMLINLLDDLLWRMVIYDALVVRFSSKPP